MNLQHSIRMNHIGFMKNSAKRFVLTENKDNLNTFTLEYIYHTKYTKVYEGKLTEKTDSNGNTVWIGDFSSVTDEGDYVVKVGNVKSRTFIIYDNAYDVCARTLLLYFTYQRCGSDLGWNGKCHTDDGYIVETGEHVDLSGGYHQSGDLRKSPAGTSIGVLGMIRYALKDNSSWGKHLLKDEVKWACDYYVKTICDTGVMYNTLNEPFGWKGRNFYKSGAPSSAQWCTTSLLALGYMYLKDDFPEDSKRYLDTAIRSWNYMVSDSRPDDKYKHPAPCPRGMDTEDFYEQCYKGSSADIAYMAVVAKDLYTATNDKKYIDYVTSSTQKLCKAMFDGEIAYCIEKDVNSLDFLASGSTYSWVHGGLLALCAAIDLCDDEEIIHKTKDAADALCRMADRNVWRNIKAIFTQKDLDKPFGHPQPGQKKKTYKDVMWSEEYVCDAERNGKRTKCVYDAKKEKIGPTGISFYGVFLMKCSKIFNDKKYSNYAQSMLDLLIGANTFDSSFINAVGYNQVNHIAFGQFFPSVPFIPGAVGIGYNSADVYECASEYDMPCVGMIMYLLSEIMDLKEE